MAKMPIEISIQTEKYFQEVEQAIDIANALQDEFTYSLTEDDFNDQLRLINFSVIDCDQYLHQVGALRKMLKGFHPFLVIFLDSTLIQKEWTNLFAGDDVKSGLSVVTSHQVEDFIITNGKMMSYFLYNLGRYSVRFCMPNHVSHSETKGCPFDFLEYKSSIVDSMRAGAFCDSCREQFLTDNSLLHARQLSALDKIFEKSGELLNSLVQTSNQLTPRLFIGSSTEGLEIARRIQQELKNDFEVEIWNQGTIFGLGDATIESLERAVKNYDFGVFVFTPDDELVSRGERKSVARDNVLFELGLFIGKLGRHRAFLIQASNDDVAIPSDLAGMTTATYQTGVTNISASVGPACQTIRDASRMALDSSTR